MDKRWPNNNVIYFFHNSIPPQARATIQGAMRVWSFLTCITFTPWRGERNFLLFGATSNTGCFSTDVGFRSGVQGINLEMPKCNQLGIVLHQIGHALGLWHEETRPDRDDYVKIHMENIRRGAEVHLVKRTASEINEQGLEYDYGSIMHSSKDAFSKNGMDTIEVVDKDLYEKEGAPTLGQMTRLSYNDYTTVNKLYQCPHI